MRCAIFKLFIFIAVPFASFSFSFIFIALIWSTSFKSALLTFSLSLSLSHYFPFFSLMMQCWLLLKASLSLHQNLNHVLMSSKIISFESFFIRVNWRWWRRCFYDNRERKKISIIVKKFLCLLTRELKMKLSII